MDIKRGQEILLQWFRHNSHEPQSMTKVRLVCKNIRNQLGDFENRNYLYHFLFPLVRIGLVEFAGEGKYILSTPSIISSKGKLISINLNDSQLEKLDKTILGSQLHSSIVYHNTQDIKEIERVTGMQSIKPNIQKLFNQIPIIKKINDVFEDADIYETKGFMFMNNNFNWNTNFAPNLLGCFKAGENIATNRYLKIEENKWKKIPSRNENPDSFNWAYCYGRLLNKFSLGIEYDPNARILNIQNIYFPIILERLLLLSSLNDIANNIERNQGELIFKNISQSLFNQLNKIFLNQLK